MKKLAVIGDPISHSLSPAMHNYISEQMGHDYRYEAVEVTDDRLSETVQKFKDEEYSGFNVTAPHKIAIMKYLDVISDDALRYGAVNTVVNRGGKLYGYNTDAEGFYLSLIHGGINPENADILILGAGGAVQSVAMHLLTKNIRSLTISNRTQEKAESIREHIQKCCGYTIGTHIDLEHYDIVINCTTLGMGSKKDLSPLSDLSLIDKTSSAVDMIYNPPETLFLSECKKQGAKTLNGLGMLIFQGVLAYELFSGTTLPDMAEKIFKDLFGQYRYSERI